MPHQAEPRIAGRHRRDQVRNHRSTPTWPALTRSALTRPFATGHGRGTILAATLGAALITGVAGGTAAAAPPAPSMPATPPPDVAAGEPSAVPPAAGLPESDPAPARITPWPSPGTLSAAAAKRKTRPAPVRTAAWVNPNPTAVVTSCFGQRWGRLHAGVDLAAANGSPILAAGAGIVVRAGAAEGYGNAVLIDHGNGYLTHYGHLSVIKVEVGRRVKAGEQIGDEGSTGHSTGPHLHFEVHQGHYKNPVEPTRWLHEHGVDIRGCGAVTG